MGFKAKRTVYKLQFADDKYEGFEICVRSVPLGDILKLEEYGSKDRSEGVVALASMLADNIESWNLEAEDDTPIKPTLEAILDQEIDFVYDIVSAWTSAITGVTEQQKKDLNNGANMAELSLPMAPLPQSQ